MIRLTALVLLTLAGVALPPNASTAASEPRWAWPVRGGHQILRPFIAPATPYSAGHRGIDIATSGDVYAPANGIVHFSGFVVDQDVLSIAHSGGVLSSYEPVSSPLSAGEAVTQGELVGTVEPGHCAELCLHFGVRVNGQYVSPLLFLGGVSRAVLLPTRVIDPASARFRTARCPGTGTALRPRSGDARAACRQVPPGDPPVPGEHPAVGRNSAERRVDLLPVDLLPVGPRAVGLLPAVLHRADRRRQHYARGCALR